MPAIDTVDFNTFLRSDTTNFRLIKKGNINDLRIDIIPSSIPKPGLNSVYKIKYENKGTTDISNVKIECVIDSKTQLQSSLPAYSQISGDTIRWDIGNVGVLESGSIGLILTVKSPPFVNDGDSISLISHISPMSGDTTPFNNVIKLKEQVSATLDPNYKLELHNGNITRQMIADYEYLSYLIRFQNTGNDTAINVCIRDDAG